MLNNPHLLNQVWSQNTQRLRSDDVRIRGKVVGKVLIKDLDLEVEHNKISVISSNDYHRSKNLREAISKGWIEILDRFTNPNNNQQQTTIVKESLDMDAVKEMAKAMAQEMVKEMSANLTDNFKQMIGEMPKQEVIYTTGNNSEVSGGRRSFSKLESVNIEEETFVDMKDSSEGNVKSLDLSGVLNEQKVNSSSVKSSLEKMKNLKMKKRSV